ncbi:hypothetical protein F2Q68_00044352 [Brassica cretica]|uniref:Uncharacterized protein n=1 Tax=Brassica cretica TaxID=69181 RepID=A0A8S9LKU9_BRACR|nr:hypothetical protein F2Q68_00044352 [Brassica cretica]
MHVLLKSGQCVSRDKFVEEMKKLRSTTQPCCYEKREELFQSPPGTPLGDHSRFWCGENEGEGSGIYRNGGLRLAGQVAHVHGRKGACVPLTKVPWQVTNILECSKLDHQVFTPLQVKFQLLEAQ